MDSSDEEMLDTSEIEVQEPSTSAKKINKQQRQELYYKRERKHERELRREIEQEARIKRSEIQKRYNEWRARNEAFGEEKEDDSEIDFDEKDILSGDNKNKNLPKLGLKRYFELNIDSSDDSEPSLPKRPRKDHDENHNKTDKEK